MPNRNEIFHAAIRVGIATLPVTTPYVVEAHIGAIQQPAPPAIIEADNRTLPNVSRNLAVERNGVAVPIGQFQGPFDPEDAKRHQKSYPDPHSQEMTTEEFAGIVWAISFVGGFATLAIVMNMLRRRY